MHESHEPQFFILSLCLTSYLLLNAPTQTGLFLLSSYWSLIFKFTHFSYRYCIQFIVQYQDMMCYNREVNFVIFLRILIEIFIMSFTLFPLLISFKSSFYPCFMYFFIFLYLHFILFNSRLYYAPCLTFHISSIPLDSLIYVLILSNHILLAYQYQLQL